MAHLIQVTEAARRLGLSRQTIVKWGEKGVLTIKEIGRAFYVDGDVIDGIADFSQDLEKAKQMLIEQKEEYDRERQEMKQSHDDKDMQRRYLNLCVRASFRTDFFQTVIGILTVYGELTEREGYVLVSLLNGESLKDVGDRIGLKRERMRQIAEKAIRKSRCLDEIKAKLDHIKELEIDNNAMKEAVKDVKSKLNVQEEEERKRLEDEREAILENDSLCQLLSTKLVECNLSVRCLNCLRSYTERVNGELIDKPIETIGDLIRLNKTDLLKMRNFGKRSLSELDDFLDSMNLEFGTDVDKVLRERAEFLMKNK